MKPVATSVRAAYTANSLTKGSNMQKSFKERWDGYNEQKQKEIRELRMAYKRYLFVVAEGADGNGDSGEMDYPEHLRMNEGFKLPLIYYNKDFKIKTNTRNFLHELGDSYLRNFAEEMLGFICLYQSERKKRWVQSGKYYDPTNLFCEEFKIWLKQLSHCDITKASVLLNAQKRCDYLNALQDSNVFIPSKGYRFTRKMLLKHLLVTLETKVIPDIQIALSRKSAREHFKELRNYNTIAARSMIKFLFYVFRNTTDTPDNFVLSQLTQPSLVCYQDAAASISGLLLRYLLHSDHAAEVFANIQAAEGSPFTAINGQQILNQFGLSIIPQHIITPLGLTVDNWFKNANSGIAPAFANLDAMQPFIRLHAFAYQLSHFSSICDSIYELAGDGGNLLVFGLAAKLIKDTMSEFEQLSTEIVSVASLLYERAKAHHSQLIDDNKTESRDNIDWCNCYKQAKDAINELKQSLKACLTVIAHIHRELKIPFTERFKQVMRKINQLRFETSAFSATNEFLLNGNSHNTLANTSIQQQQHRPLSFNPGANQISSTAQAEQALVTTGDGDYRQMSENVQYLYQLMLQRSTTAPQPSPTSLQTQAILGVIPGSNEKIHFSKYRQHVSGFKVLQQLGVTYAQAIQTFAEVLHHKDDCSWLAEEILLARINQCYAFNQDTWSALVSEYQHLQQTYQQIKVLQCKQLGLDGKHINSIDELINIVASHDDTDTIQQLLTLQKDTYCCRKTMLEHCTSSDAVNEYIYSFAKKTPLGPRSLILICKYMKLADIHIWKVDKQKQRLILDNCHKTQLNATEIHLLPGKKPGHYYILNRVMMNFADTNSLHQQTAATNMK